MASISVELPPEIYEHLKREAKSSQRTLEEVLIENLGLMAGTPSFDLEIQDTFPDEKLWAIVHKRLPASQSERISALVANHARTEAEQQELDRLLNQADDLVILRSRALVILKERGHNVAAYLTREP